MEEGKKANLGWIRILGILIQGCSVIAVLVIGIYCTKQGYKDYLFYDRERGELLPLPGFVKACTVTFWAGFAGGMMVVAYDMMQNAEKITRILQTVFAALALFLTMYVNAFVASSMYVDEGLGIKPRYEVVGEGDEFFVIAHCEKWRTVQVYYVVHYLDRDRAYWVDGYDSKTSRTYALTKDPNAILSEERLITIGEEGKEYPRTASLNLMSFPLEQDWK